MRLYLYNEDLRAIGPGKANGYESEHSYIHMPSRLQGFVLWAYQKDSKKTVVFSRDEPERGA